MNRSRTRFAWITSVLVGIAINPISVLAETEEVAAWQAAQQSGISQDVYAFIQAYPNGQHAKDAKALMIDLLWLELEDDSPAHASKAEDIVSVVGEEADVETQEIEIRSSDGLVSLTGTIVDFDDDFITIQTSQGVLGIENLGISCIGAACPPELLAAR